MGEQQSHDLHMDTITSMLQSGWALCSWMDSGVRQQQFDHPCMSKLARGSDRAVVVDRRINPWVAQQQPHHLNIALLA
jgi:hypothetical protein